MLSRIARERRQFIEKQWDRRRPKILEIGAFDNATFRREMGDDVYYLDFFSAEELREQHKGNLRRNMDNIVDVDFVVKSHRFADGIGQSFDIIVANHVLEHVADPILWFEQIEVLLGDSGVLFLALPDRRYTFDYFRPESLATQMIRAHDEGLQKPDKWQLAEHFYYHQKVDVARIWAGTPPGTFAPRFSLRDALRMAEQKSQQYTDAHCWVFTSSSFRQCVKDLRSAGVLALSALEVVDPRFGNNEFWVLLGR